MKRIARPRTAVSFNHAIMEMVLNPNRFTDSATKEFVKRLGPVGLRAAQKWKALKKTEQQRRYSLPTGFSMKDTLKANVSSFVETWRAVELMTMEQFLAIKRAEYCRALQSGIWNYQPSREVAAKQWLSESVHIYIANKIGMYHDPNVTTQTPQEVQPPSTKYGAKVTGLHCYNHTEAGSDEIYVISTAVDGKGKILVRPSGLISKVNAETQDFFVSHWAYPTDQANGFLDLAFELYEDDGGYQEVADALKEIGDASQLLGEVLEVPELLIASAVLGIVVGILDLAGYLDQDDCFGTGTMPLLNASAIQAAIGSHSIAYVGEDWAGDNYDYALDVQVYAVA
ncbi:MAG: hypothetical protein HYZ31_02770 [Gammaproteobacteria bacterium]|nr:hypothetical protein [Gammaproteobacteria bacterium]